jgi:hypothetical protein
MNTEKANTAETGIDNRWPLREKIAVWAIILIVAYLFIVR